MLSRLGRFIRGRFARGPGRTSKDHGGPEERPGTEAAGQAEGDPFARQVLRRTRPLSVSRTPSHLGRSLAVSGGRPLPQATAPRVRHDVPVPELPLAVPARPRPAPEEEQAGGASSGDTQFYEESTGDARWDALWATRGTARTAPEAAPPDREGPRTPVPRERPAPRPSEPARRGPSSAPRSVQRAPSPAARGIEPSGEGAGRAGVPPAVRMPEEAETEPPGKGPGAVEREATGEGTAATRPLPRQIERPQAPAPGQPGQAEEQPQRASEGTRPAAPPGDAAPPSSVERRAPAEGAVAPGTAPTRRVAPPNVQRRLVPRSTLEEMPTRREAPPRTTSARPVPEPRPEVSAEGEAHAIERQGRPSPAPTPAPAAAPVQRASAATGGEEEVPAEESSSAADVGSEAVPADRAPPAVRRAGPDRPREEAGHIAAQPPAPLQQTPSQSVAQPAGSGLTPPEVPPAPQAPAGRAVPGMEAIAEQGTREPPLAERQAVERPLVERPGVERLLDERPMGERPSGERRSAEPREPARGQLRQTVPEPPQAREREAGRELPPAGVPAAPSKVPHEPALPTGTGGRPVQAQRATRPASGLPVEEPAVEKPAAEKPLPAAKDTAREQAAAGRADAGEVAARGAEAQEAGAAAARIQRAVGAQGAREAEPDRRTLLRQALQPRIVPTVVQAAPADGAQGAGAAGQEAQAAAASEAEGEPDVESLARDVYRILRRRLLVERERDLGAR